MHLSDVFFTHWHTPEMNSGDGLYRSLWDELGPAPEFLSYKHVSVFGV